MSEACKDNNAGFLDCDALPLRYRARKDKRWRLAKTDERRSLHKDKQNLRLREGVERSGTTVAIQYSRRFIKGLQRQMNKAVLDCKSLDNPKKIFGIFIFTT